MSMNTKYINKWEGYYLKDCDCEYCLYYEGKKLGCRLGACCSAEEKTMRKEAVRPNNRGWAE